MWLVSDRQGADAQSKSMALVEGGAESPRDPISHPEPSQSHERSNSSSIDDVIAKIGTYPQRTMTVPDPVPVPGRLPTRMLPRPDGSPVDLDQPAVMVVSLLLERDSTDDDGRISAKSQLIYQGEMKKLPDPHYAWGVYYRVLAQNRLVLDGVIGDPWISCENGIELDIAPEVRADDAHHDEDLHEHSAVPIQIPIPFSRDIDTIEVYRVAGDLDPRSLTPDSERFFGRFSIGI